MTKRPSCARVLAVTLIGSCFLRPPDGRTTPLCCIRTPLSGGGQDRATGLRNGPGVGPATRRVATATGRAGRHLGGGPRGGRQKCCILGGFPGREAGGGGGVGVAVMLRWHGGSNAVILSCRTHTAVATAGREMRWHGTGGLYIIQKDQKGGPPGLKFQARRKKKSRSAVSGCSEGRAPRSGVLGGSGMPCQAYPKRRAARWARCGGGPGCPSPAFCALALPVGWPGETISVTFL